MTIQPFTSVLLFIVKKNQSCFQEINSIINILKQCGTVQLLVYSYEYHILWVQTEIPCRLVACCIRNLVVVASKPGINMHCGNAEIM